MQGRIYGGRARGSRPPGEEDQEDINQEPKRNPKWDKQDTEKQNATKPED